MMRVTIIITKPSFTRFVRSSATPSGSNNRSKSGMGWRQAHSSDEIVVLHTVKKLPKGFTLAPGGLIWVNWRIPRAT